MIFMVNLASRLANRVQLTSDGHEAYLEAVEGAFSKIGLRRGQHEARARLKPMLAPL